MTVEAIKSAGCTKQAYDAASHLPLPLPVLDPARAVGAHKTLQSLVTSWSTVALVTQSSCFGWKEYAVGHFLHSVTNMFT